MGELESLIKSSTLDKAARDEANIYLKAAQMSAQKEKPKVESLKENLENLAETLSTASKTVDSGQTLWETAKPILGKIAGWLIHLGTSITTGSFLAGL